MPRKYKYTAKKRTTKPRTRIQSRKSGGKPKTKVFTKKQMAEYIAAVKAHRGEEE